MPDSKTHAGQRGDRDLDASLQLAIAETMQALSTPSRVRLLYALAKGEASVGSLAEAAEMTPAAASQQLRVLRNLKLVTSRREGQTVMYQLYDHHIQGLLEEIRNHVEHAVRGWSRAASSLSHR
jgi:DNA-binding transcriptional ArsR family regulator